MPPSNDATINGPKPDTRAVLYPVIEPHKRGHLRLDDRHVMYFEECGNPQGAPVLFLHGGPGAGASPEHRRFFDPAYYRIVIFDQRGAGRSTPLGALHDNTTQHLIADIEHLRDHLGIERWQVFGGSWGSTLALAYAQNYPERVTALVLRGIFLGRPQEISWFLDGMRSFFPENWEQFANFLPQEERADLLAAYYSRLCHPDPEVHMPAARAWSRYEGSCSTLLPSQGQLAGTAHDQAALSLARLEAHYFINNIFLKDGALLAGIPQIRHIPGVIVQGRYDVICPIMTADALHRAWPEATYQVIDAAGHSAMEPGISTALVAATDRFRS